ncbi:VOC family protein [Pseudomonas typographi]|uniref:VOC family protein n=1 Tax=Pseudomonas typographi TaxID=2715964 RepID=UPI0016837F4B|nr:VOC family protein [Pseudomonas typographi]MBD1554962.1 hypothetical protein [Pseudomonas typographi]
MSTPTASALPRVTHLALWTRDIDTLCAFYAKHLDATVGPLYLSQTRPFSSRFLTFGGDVQLEVMHLPNLQSASAASRVGLAHVAFQLGSRDAVDAKVLRLAEHGIDIEGAPRLTGDGYYEAVIRDPDGNLIELVG